jgi:hypothetical protein
MTAETFLAQIKEVQPSAWLLESLRRGLSLAQIIGTEKANRLVGK